MRILLLPLALAALPAFAAPVCDGAVADPARDRSVPVRIRMPEGGDARAPVILFSHGLGGSVDAGTDFAREWAKAGFLVVHVQHPGSDRSVWQGKRQPRAALERAAGGQQLRDRIADMRLVADAVQAGRSIGACSLARADPARMGAAGHSFGAHTVMALAGQRLGPLGAPGQDPRFKAVAALSPTAPRNDATLADAAFGQISIPVLAATGSADGSPLAKGKSLEQVVEARAAVFRSLPASRSGKATVGLWVNGADHAAFGGNSGTRKSTDPRVTRLIAETTTAFFRAHLADRRQQGGGVPDMQVARTLLRPGDRIDQK